MEAKHWIGIGCGGCLGIILLIAGLIAGSVFYVRNMAREAEKSTQEIHALKDKYPFTSPENNQIDSERFSRFLNAREKNYTECKNVFSPFNEFIAVDLTKNDYSQYKIFTSVMTILTHVPQLNHSHLETLKSAEMSPQEYKYWTTIMAQEISTWQKIEDAPDKKLMAENFFAPLKKYQENARIISARKPGTNLGNSPFDYDAFMRRIKENDYKNEKNADVVFAQKDRILSSPSTIFLDAWILDFTTN